MIFSVKTIDITFPSGKSLVNDFPGSSADSHLNSIARDTIVNFSWSFSLVAWHGSCTDYREVSKSKTLRFL